MFAESKTTEFKREYADGIKNTVVAFANCDGGTIYIGVEDDGSVCGVNDADSVMLRITNAVRDVIRPDITMFVDCRSEIFDGKTVVCVTVQRGMSRPYYIYGKGIRPEGVFVRHGASTVPASNAAILAMIKETGGDSYEVARSVEQQLSFEKTSAYFKKRNVEFGNSQMRTLHMIGDDGTFTNLALLLSEQNPHTVKLAVFEGSKKTVFKDRYEFSGSLLAQLESVYDYIDKYNRTRAEFLGLDRVDIRDYPVEAVREALLNSIVHKDYSFSGSTLISIFDDRIEFVTIGGLVKGISLDDIMLGVSVLRNQHLANIFYRLKLIEAYGTGILKINECYADCAVKPQIEASSNAFKIILPNINFYAESVGKSGRRKNFEQHDSKVNAVLAVCRKQGYVVRKDIEGELGVSQATAIKLLREMTENGTLIKKGNAKNIRYFENK